MDTERVLQIVEEETALYLSVVEDEVRQQLRARQAPPAPPVTLSVDMAPVAAALAANQPAAAPDLAPLGRAIAAAIAEAVAPLAEAVGDMSLLLAQLAQRLEQQTRLRAAPRSAVIHHGDRESTVTITANAAGEAAFVEEEEE